MRRIEHLNEIADVLANARSAVLHSAACTPASVSEQLADGAAQWPNLEIRPFMPLVPAPYSDAGGLPVSTIFTGGTLRKAANEGRVTIVRNTLLEHAVSYRDGTRTADIAFLQTTPPGADGRVWLGPSHDMMEAVIAHEPFIVVTFNRNVPRCGLALDARRIDAVIEDHRPLGVMQPAQPDDVDRAIATNVMRLLSDGITLETGIGSVPEAVLTAAVGLKRLTLHSGLINDGVMALPESVPITTTLAAGTEGFYRWLDGNERVDFQPIIMTHAPETLADLPNFHAVNGALQVDLTGTVNTEIVGGRFISTPGGLPDFANGTRLSRSGKSIIALRSTARRGELSNVVRSVERKTLPGDMVEYIVTEHGIAELTADDDTRAAAIRAIADPAHRRNL